MRGIKNDGTLGITKMEGTVQRKLRRHREENWERRVLHRTREAFQKLLRRVKRFH